MIIAIILSIVLMLFAYALRNGLDETLWHEANMFVTGDGNLIVIE